MSLTSSHDGYYDENGYWKRTKFCFVSCGDRCTCLPPNGQWHIPINSLKGNNMIDEPKTCLTDGSPVSPDHKEIDPKTGMQKGYIALCPEERAKGFIRPLRFTYTHKTCGIVTRMHEALAETYARDPKFYSGTYCVHCKQHFHLSEFTWEGSTEIVGS